ncbi:MAG TPA: hypothetical protein VGY53_06425, partial [Isosphaeraceae bacterium]|nr:hypothetical protein [Isosphaeraceae bacterium]
MRKAKWVAGLVAAGIALGGVSAARAGEAEVEAVERGRVALTQKSFVPPAWSENAYKNAGRLWSSGASEPSAANAEVPEPDPKIYASEFNRRYGLHSAPYPNDGLPMGLKRSRSADGAKMGIQIDCLVCHGGSIGGKSYIGLGNTTLDLHALLTDLTRADGHIPFPFGFRLNDTRGLTRAGQVSAFLLSFRNTDLSPRVVPLLLKANLPEMDTPAWWILGRKATMYYDGRTDARAARSLMQFYLGHFNLRDFKDLEPTFHDVLTYLKSLKPPKYPFEIDSAKADRGHALFTQNCTKCHGTY